MDKIKEDIIAILRDQLRDYFQNHTIERLYETIIKVDVFHPFELDFNDLNNISGRVNFQCQVEGKMRGVTSRTENYLFRVSDIKTLMKDNKVIGLNLDDMKILHYD